MFDPFGISISIELSMCPPKYVKGGFQVTYRLCLNATLDDFPRLWHIAHPASYMKQSASTDNMARFSLVLGHFV
jgi:hypothetical protein